MYKRRQFGKKTTVVAIAAVLAVLALLGGYKLYRKIIYYESSSILFVKTRESRLTTWGNMLLSTQLSKDYVSVIYTHGILEKAIEEAQADITYEELVKELEVENVKETRMLKLTVTDRNEEQAKALAVSIADIAAERFADIFETNAPVILESGE